MTCASTYNAGRGLWLHCTGEHLRGNAFRGEAHQQTYGGIVWTWYEDEAGMTRPTPPHGHPRRRRDGEMSTDLRRIATEDAEEFDQETEALLRRWAAVKLDVPEPDIARVLVEVTGGCGEGTCEFTTARAEVDLNDGRVFLGENLGFGLFIQDVVEMDVNPDGTERRPAHMWDLYDTDGKKVQQPEPPKAAPKPPTKPSEPMLGAFRMEQKQDRFGMITDRRVDVLTRHGWVNLLEVIAAYDAAQDDE